MCQRRCILFPIGAVEVFNRNLIKAALVQAIYIDAVTIRIRSWHVEGLDPAVPAKQVFSRPGIELVAAQIVRAAKQLEVIGRHDQVKESGH